MKVTELKIGNVYDVQIEQTLEIEGKEPVKKDATVDAVKLTSIQHWEGDVVFYRFESVVNNTTLILNHENKLVGDFSEYEVVDIVDAEPRIIKHVHTKEKDLIEALKAEFKDENLVDNVFKFIKETL